MSQPIHSITMGTVKTLPYLLTVLRKVGRVTEQVNKDTDEVPKPDRMDLVIGLDPRQGINGLVVWVHTLWPDAKTREKFVTDGAHGKAMKGFYDQTTQSAKDNNVSEDLTAQLINPTAYDICRVLIDSLTRSMDGTIGTQSTASRTDLTRIAFDTSTPEMRIVKDPNGLDRPIIGLHLTFLKGNLSWIKFTHPEFVEAGIHSQMQGFRTRHLESPPRH